MSDVADDDRGFDRREFLRRATAVSLGTVAGRGVYALLDGQGFLAPSRAHAAPTRRRQEQYLVEQVEVILDNGVPVAVPPIYTDVITATLRVAPTAKALKAAQTRFETALARVESGRPPTAAGLTMVVGWGLPYFRRYLPSLQSRLPVDVGASKAEGRTVPALLDAVKFPSDPDNLVLETNDVVLKLRSDSQSILAAAERALFEDPADRAYVGDLFTLTSKRIGFLGRGFGNPSAAKTLALAAGVADADKIPDNAQLMMGFTSTQHAALGPDNILSFETLPGMTDQWPNGYWTAGCAMHLSHLDEDLSLWYRSFDYGERVRRMFSPGAAVPSTDTTVTIPNGPAEVATLAQVKADAAAGHVGHNSALQQATRLGADVVDNYGRRRPKGTPVPLREDFNTLDAPFAWFRDATGTARTPVPNQPGMHFVVFVPTSQRFHTARMAMDGVLPDGTDLRIQGSTPLHARDLGINKVITTTHRQNFIVPPRARRSFPLAELLA